MLNRKIDEKKRNLKREVRWIEAISCLEINLWCVSTCLCILSGVSQAETECRNSFIVSFLHINTIFIHILSTRYDILSLTFLVVEYIIVHPVRTLKLTLAYKLLLSALMKISLKYTFS